MHEDRQVLLAMALMGELISEQRQLEFKENQDVGSITEVAVPKVHGVTKCETFIG